MPELFYPSTGYGGKTEDENTSYQYLSGPETVYESSHKP
jgi:hypothetical protein